MGFTWALPVGIAALLLVTAGGTDNGTSAATPATMERASEVSAQQKKRRAARQPRAPSTKIACTRLGCHPIPPGCTPVTQYNWRGMPTSFDAILCR